MGGGPDQRAPRFQGASPGVGGAKTLTSKAPATAVDDSWSNEESIGSAQHGEEQNIN